MQLYYITIETMWYYYDLISVDCKYTNYDVIIGLLSGSHNNAHDIASYTHVGSS